MFILIEIDTDWTVGLDWHKNSKGVRLGFVAIHFCNEKHKDFVGRISEYYHQLKLENMKDKE
ncbi:hypothetical protein ACWE42_15025 [Sutcliffiella cohnii]